MEKFHLHPRCTRALRSFLNFRYMKCRYNLKRNNLLIVAILFTSLLAFLGTGCIGVQKKELYHKFAGNVWGRFNLLSFEVPIEKADTWDIYLFTRVTPAFQHETLDFNMVMNTPAGEERIREYQLAIKSKSGNFCIICSNDSCEGTILLKRAIMIAKPGILKIEIENLTPRISTEGVLGVGIRLVPSEK